MSSSSALPPLGNLPSWSRVSTLDRSRYPKPFLRDRLQTLPPPPPHSELGERQLDIPVQVIDSMPGDQHNSNRIVYYNKSIQFLQQQHAETLMKLHEEIEDLKRANKDLQFKIIMRKSSSRGVREASEIQDVIGQEEIKDLRQRLKDAQARNVKLTHALRKFSKRPSDEGAGGSPPTSEGSATGDEAGGSTPGNNADVDSISRRRHSRDHSPPADAVILPLGAILNPLRIKQTKDEAEDEYCEPSFRECEIIINHLYNLSVRQSEENGCLRADLAHAKKASRRGSTKTNRSDDVTHFPRVSLNEAPSAKRNSAASSQATAERVNLPALKQTLNTNVADRRKRMQAVKSNKSRKKHSFDQY